MSKGNKSRLGMTNSPKTRKKISKAMKGKMPKNFQLAYQLLSASRWGNKNHLGHKHSKEAKNKMSKKAKLRIGEKNSAWKGGKMAQYPEYERIRKSVEYLIWREAIFKRDNWTCVWCGDNKGGNLNADHIKPFALLPELRFAIDNGRTLCVPCHRMTDTFAGKGFKRT